MYKHAVARLHSIVVRATALRAGDRGSISGRVIPTTVEMVLHVMAVLPDYQCSGNSITTDVTVSGCIITVILIILLYWSYWSYWSYWYTGHTGHLSRKLDVHNTKQTKNIVFPI